MRKISILLLTAALAAILTGCGPRIVNLTSAKVPQNPSGIYTLSMSVKTDDATIRRDRMRAMVVVDGQEREMRRTDRGDLIFEYDLRLPGDYDEVPYYYVLYYTRDARGRSDEKSVATDIQRFRLTDRYVITMESNRGPVGSEIPVVGRGFTEFDSVLVGGLEADTAFASSTSISFLVPPLPSGRAYRVEIVSGRGTLPIGYFQVDPSVMRVHPQQLRINAGERAMLVFGIDNPAPEGGLPVEILTDIPRSVIMPRVVFPGGARSVSVPIEGGRPGSGIIQARASGFVDLTVPVEVVGSAPARDVQQQPPAPSPQPRLDEVIIFDFEEAPAPAAPTGDVILEEVDTFEIF